MLLNWTTDTLICFLFLFVFWDLSFYLFFSTNFFGLLFGFFGFMGFFDLTFNKLNK